MEWQKKGIRNSEEYLTSEENNDDTATVFREALVQQRP